MASKRRQTRNLEKKKCGKKVRYATLDEANRACTDIRWKEGKRVSGYLCPFCKGFHWGHTPSKIVSAPSNTSVSPC